MGSSLTEPQAIVIASLFGVLFLFLDTLRFFVNQLGPVKMKSWSGENHARNRWLGYDQYHFTILSGAVLQICITAAAAFTIPVFANRGIVRAVMITIVLWSVISILWKVVIALVPESIAEAMVRVLLPVTNVFYYLFWPLLFPLRFVLDRVDTKRENDVDEEEVTDEEIQAYIDVGEEEGILEEGQGKLLQSIVDFGDTLAKELMTPRTDVVAFEARGSLEELARLFSESKYSRIPIYEDNIDRVIGIIHVKDVFEAHLRGSTDPVKLLARRAYFVPETKRVAELLREFQIEHLQIAIVVDEFGGMAGLLTIEDVVEEIVGEIADEHEDSDESIIEVDRDVFLVNGLVRIDTIDEKLGVDLSGDDYETVAGLIFTQAGRVPKIGEKIAKGGLIFEVERADRKRIYRVRVTRDPDYNEEEEAARG